MPNAERLIRIRSYNRQIILVTANFDKESYNAGDTVNGVVNVTRTDGVPFDKNDILSFSYEAKFGNVSTINKTDQEISYIRKT